MKRIPKPLRLTSETLRLLAPQQLREVAGGDTSEFTVTANCSGGASVGCSNNSCHICRQN